SIHILSCTSLFSFRPPARLQKERVFHAARGERNRAAVLGCIEQGRCRQLPEGPVLHMAGLSKNKVSHIGQRLELGAVSDLNGEGKMNAPTLALGLHYGTRHAGYAWPCQEGDGREGEHHNREWCGEED